MICLFCKAELPEANPHICPGCEVPHEPRPPVVGINHVSQLLCALDELRAGEIEPDEFEEIAGTFYDLFSDFEERWQTAQTPLHERLAGEMKQTFGPAVSQIDEALQLGFRAMDALEAIPTHGVEAADEAEEALILFFRQVCANAAALLEKLDQLKSEDRGSGVLFNLPSA